MFVNRRSGKVICIMSKSYITQARAAQNAVLDTVEFPNAAMRQQITVRPPKEIPYGDLSSNSCIILKSKENIDFNIFSKKLREAFEELDGIAEVRLEDNGYLNIKYNVNYWLNSIIPVFKEGPEFGVEGITAGKYIFPAPAEIVDLASYRQQVNFDALSRIAAVLGTHVEREILPAREAEGFPHTTAMAKCTEVKARFAVLANPPGFLDAFSPILAIDKSYDNPVFAIPYARLLLERLGATAEEAKAEVNDGVEMSVLELPEERALARYLNDWPLALEQALRKGDAFYLASFLQELSLLFFRLVERVHPISSNYLTTEAERPARLCLLGALDRILISGVRLLGVDAVKEYG